MGLESRGNFNSGNHLPQSDLSDFVYETGNLFLGGMGILPNFKLLVQFPRLLRDFQV
jgi:hypothetical protein